MDTLQADRYCFRQYSVLILCRHVPEVSSLYFIQAQRIFQILTLHFS
jgi:hypothetical protein